MAQDTFSLGDNWTATSSPKTLRNDLLIPNPT